MSEAVDIHILDAIPFEPDAQELQKRLRVRPGSSSGKELERLLNDARLLARPRALYRIAYIIERGEDWVDIEGRRFDSRVLRVNLEGTHRVFASLATCGLEMQEWADGIDDLLLRFWAETIKESALYCAVRALETDIDQRYQPGKTSYMSPGSLKDWPIEQQRVLFDLFETRQAVIGVRLTDSMLMVPTKTVSGMRFPTETSFASCQLCPRENCPNRRAPYEPELYTSRYQISH
jgi:hypothetical protein